MNAEAGERGKGSTEQGTRCKSQVGERETGRMSNIQQGTPNVEGGGSWGEWPQRTQRAQRGGQERTWGQTLIRDHRE